jgi:hypothetical protein
MRLAELPSPGFQSIYFGLKSPQGRSLPMRSHVAKGQCVCVGINAYEGQQIRVPFIQTPQKTGWANFPRTFDIGKPSRKHILSGFKYYKARCHCLGFIPAHLPRNPEGHPQFAASSPRRWKKVRLPPAPPPYPFTSCCSDAVAGLPPFAPPPATRT